MTGFDCKILSYIITQNKVIDGKMEEKLRFIFTDV